jgi:hypothetical protein
VHVWAGLLDDIADGGMNMVDVNLLSRFKW